jgi:hypothetical protein
LGYDDCSFTFIYNHEEIHMQESRRCWIAAVLGMLLMILALTYLDRMEPAIPVAGAPPERVERPITTRPASRFSLSETTPVSAYLPLVSHHCCSRFFEDFDDPGTGWLNGETVFGEAYYVDGEYRLVNQGINMWFAGVSPEWIVPQDSVVRTEARIDGGRFGQSDDPSMSLVFGLKLGSVNDKSFWIEWYEFRITPLDQRYGLWEYSNLGDIYDVIEYGNSNAIIPALDATQQLEVRRRDDEILLMINGTELATVVDDEYPFTGRRSVGVGAGDFYTVTFDNFEVRGTGCITTPFVVP